MQTRTGLQQHALLRRALAPRGRATQQRRRLCGRPRGALLPDRAAAARQPALRRGHRRGGRRVRRDVVRVLPPGCHRAGAGAAPRHAGAPRRSRKVRSLRCWPRGVAAFWLKGARTNGGRAASHRRPRGRSAGADADAAGRWLRGAARRGSRRRARGVAWRGCGAPSCCRRRGPSTDTKPRSRTTTACCHRSYSWTHAARCRRWSGACRHTSPPRRESRTSG